MSQQSPMEWHEAVEKVQPYVYRILTPTMSGTGFLVSHSANGDLLGIATAAHVVSYAEQWQQPVRIEHFQSKQTILLPPEKRVVLIDVARDTAVIVFDSGTLAPPKNPPELMEEGFHIKVGVEVGWVGFPSVSPPNFCFFSGRVSCVLETDSAYLVDGVAINGVSGGPAFWLAYDRVIYVGVVASYIPNRVTGEPLPGLSVVRDVTQFHEIVKQFRSLDDARRQQQTQASQPPGDPTQTRPVGAPEQHGKDDT